MISIQLYDRTKNKIPALLALHRERVARGIAVPAMSTVRAFAVRRARRSGRRTVLALTAVFTRVDADSSGARRELPTVAGPAVALKRSDRAAPVALPAIVALAERVFRTIAIAA